MIFVTVDITRAIGLEEKYKDLKIVCLYESDIISHLHKSGTEVLCLHEYGKEIKPITASILADEDVKKWINEKEKNPEILVFKPTAKIEAICKHNGWKLINPKSELNRLYEDKISFYEVCQELGLNNPKSLIKPLSELTWDDCKTLGKKVILQLRRGHAGETSFIIDSKKRFNQVKKSLSPHHQTKVSEFIEGETWTWNCEIGKKGKVIIGFPMKQISGVSDLNRSKLGTCGVTVDTSFEMPKSLEKEVQKLGKHMFENGYVGVFGIDAIITKKNAYLIECNARFTATISFHTQLESLKKVSHASQIILRNTEDVPIRIQHDLKSGIYTKKSGEIVLKKETIHLNELKGEDFLLLIRKSGSIINPGLEIGYVQALKALSTHEISPIVTNTLAKIEKNRLESYIDPQNFLKNTFGSVRKVADVLKKPLENHKKLVPRAITRNRQTQCIPEEPSFRILGERNGYFLIEKYDGTKGWLWKNEAEEGKKTVHNDDLMSSETFFEKWKDVPYLWGGITGEGIDCSGLIQRYFLDTKRVFLPKHSQDQRKMGTDIDKKQLKNDDLVFLSIDERKHVGLYRDNAVWHACLRRKKVVSESLGEIQKHYKIDAIKRILH
jgi:cell wall-associated NlpC family hydrolase/glutathione synthase/RimK-type ligase-like ATP-grasp enzyme